MVHKMRIADIKMFFLPAELAKEAGNEVLSHRMGSLGWSQDVM